VPAGGNIVSTIDETVRARALRQAVARLAPEHRVVLARVFFRGMSIVDVATELDIPPVAVRARTYLALCSLRAALDEANVDSE
jgi:RNA polymerase sigma-70 factor (ECF subfamily)